MSSPLLDIKQLRVSLPVAKGMLHAVRGIDIQLERGQAIGIVGESGSGKSMTALALMRLLPNGARISADSFKFQGQDLLSMSDHQFAQSFAGKKIAMIFQEPMTSLNPVYTIERQMIESYQRNGHSYEAARKRALYLLERVKMPHPEERLRSYPHQLSGGQRQRVMIAMALMNEPDLIIADEPTTALDVTVQAEILQLLAELRAEFGMAMILITHDLAVVSETVDHVVVVYGGEALESGRTQAVLTTPQHPYTQGLLQCVPVMGQRVHRLGAIPGIVPSLIGDWTGCIFAPRCSYASTECHQKTIPITRLTTPEVRQFKCLHPQDFTPPQASPALESVSVAQPDVLLSAQGICKTYRVKKSFFAPVREIKAVDQVSLDVHTKEVVAIVGESGSGKSTLAKILLGLDHADQGAIQLMGHALHTLPLIERARLVQPIFQDPYSSLNPRRTIGEIIVRPLDIHQIGTQQERQKKVEDSLAVVGLPSRVINSFPNQLSGGQRQRVAIARALILRPRLLICDEPTSALDVSVQAQILNLLQDLKEELGLSLLFITHDIGVVQQVADRIIVMNHGKIVEQGPVDRLLKHPQEAYTQVLLNSVPVFNA